MAGGVGIGQQCDIIASEVDRGVERAIASEFTGSLKPKEGEGEGCPKHNMVQIMGKFGLKVGVNRMENSKGNGKTVKPLGRSKALNACQDLL